ncbi:hypothetical protein BMS3Bbin02_01202 [bacterium BMS3Bbin02]|nr:hypothetical protein BMS3Bbin02_01202 [bacterium BMS3Bbin02]
MVAPAGAVGRLMVEFAATEHELVINEVLALYDPNRPWNVWTGVGTTACALGARAISPTETSSRASARAIARRTEDRVTWPPTIVFSLSRVSCVHTTKKANLPEKGANDFGRETVLASPVVA